MSVIYGDEKLQDFNNRRAEIRDNRISISNNKKATTEFEVKIIEYSRADPLFVINETKIYRKFKDFEELHKALQVRFSMSLPTLPQLPAKYNEFSGQKKVETIMQGLGRYLDTIFRLPKIFDSFAFRKFVNCSKKFQSFYGRPPNEIESANTFRRKNTTRDDDVVG